MIVVITTRRPESAFSSSPRFRTGRARPYRLSEQFVIDIPPALQGDQCVVELEIANQGSGLHGERSDGLGFKLLAESREHSPVPTPGQSNERLAAGVVVFVSEPFDEGSSKLGRVHFHLRSQSKACPITDVSFRVSRRFDEETDGPSILVSHQGKDDGVANIGVVMATETRCRLDRTGLAEVRQGDQDRPEDIRMRLDLQRAQESAKTRLGEGALGNTKLPQDIRPHTALDRTGTQAEPDGPVQDLVGSPPVQGADSIPGEILIGTTQDG
jgi:hypothetical protein